MIAWLIFFLVLFIVVSVEVEFFAEGLVAVAEVASEAVDTKVATTIAIPAPAILPLGFSKDELFLSRGLREVFYIQVVVGLVCCHGREIIEAGWVCKQKLCYSGTP